MDQQPEKSPIVIEPSIKEISTDIMLFKEEILRDFRKLELQLKGRIDKTGNEIDKKVISNQNQLKELTGKLNALTVIINNNSSKSEKIDQILSIQTKMEDKLINNELKLSSVSRDLFDSCYKYDKIYLNNLLMPGLIGDHCKFSNLKEYIQWVNIQISNLNTFKDKQLIDLKAYKTKLDSSIETFQNSIERIKGNFIDFCKESVDDCEERFKQRIIITEELINNMRVENGTHALTLKNETHKVRVDWDKMMELKKEIFEKMTGEIGEYKQASKKNLEVCSLFQKEFQLIKSKFTELSDFIRDVRFRRGMEVKRKEFYEMSKKMNFNLKKNNVSQDEINVDEFLPPPNRNNNAVIRRSNKKFPTEIIHNKIEIFGKEEYIKQKIKPFKNEEKKGNRIKYSASKINQVNNTKFNAMSLHKRVSGDKDILKVKKLTELNITPNTNTRDIQIKTPNPLLIDKNLNTVSVVKTNNRVSSTPISLNDSQDNTEIFTHRDHIRFYLNQKDNINSKYLQLRDKRNYGKWGLQQNIINGNGLNIRTGMISAGHHNISNDNQNNRITYDNLPSSSKVRYNYINNKEKVLDYQINNNLPTLNPQAKNVRFSPYKQEDKVIIDLSQKLSLIESRIGYIEQTSNQKLDQIFQELKQFKEQSKEDTQAPGNKVQNSGYYSPLNFEENSILNYNPQKIQKILNQSKSQIYNKKSNKEDLYLNQTKPVLNKILNKNKNSSSDIRQTYSSLSVLLTNIPKVIRNDNPSMLLNTIYPYIEKDKI